MATKTLEAIIVSRRNVGEADRLLTAFSKTEGKIKILARGARKITSKMACHIEPFTYGKYFLAEGKNHYILAGSESENPCFGFAKNIKRYQALSFVMEVIDMVTVENMPNSNLFLEAKEVIRHLNSGECEDIEVILDYFVFQVLKHVGYALNVQTCKKCGEKLKEQKSYPGDSNGFTCEKCSSGGRKYDLAVLKILRIFDENMPSKALAINNFKQYHNEIKDILFSSLYDILPKMPKSLKL